METQIELAQGLSTLPAMLDDRPLRLSIQLDLESIIFFIWVLVNYSVHGRTNPTSPRLLSSSGDAVVKSIPYFKITASCC